MGKISVVCFLASYLVAFALEWTRLIRRNSISRFVCLLMGAAGFVAHTVYLVERSRQANLPPLLSSTHDWLLVLAWVAIVLYLFLTTFERDLAVGLFLLPLVLLLIAAAYFVSHDPRLAATGAREAARRGWVMLHSSLLVFGTAGVLLGFVLSMMYLVQHRRLKHKQTVHAGLALPSLERLASLNWWSVMISVPLLTLGLLAGAYLGFLAREGPAAVTFRDPVVIGSTAVWLVMAALFVWLARSNRAAGRQVAWLTIWAVGFLMVTLVGLQVLTGGKVTVLESWHAGAGRDGETRRAGGGRCPSGEWPSCRRPVSPSPRLAIASSPFRRPGV